MKKQKHELIVTLSFARPVDEKEAQRLLSLLLAKVMEEGYYEKANDTQGWWRLQQLILAFCEAPPIKMTVKSLWRVLAARRLPFGQRRILTEKDAYR